VDPAALSAAAKWFAARRAAWEQNLDRLEDILRESDDDTDDDPGKKKRTKRSRR
jgi:hypothetical protein